MRKLAFFSVVFAASLLIFASAGAKKANAQVLGDTALISGYLDNSTGTIPITVTIYFNTGTISSPVLLPPPNPKLYTVPAGQTLSASYADLIDRGQYNINWSTSCSDPPAQAISAVVPGAYIFPSQDVHCKSANATPNITNTACANFGWNLTGVGVDGANIGRFDIYISQNSGEIGPGDPSIAKYDSVGSGARSYDFGSSGKSGTYYVRVRAVSPQWIAGESGSSGSWSSVGSFNCGAAISPASNLNASASCAAFTGSGAIVNVDFSWGAASAGSTVQYLDYSVYNNNFAGGTYSHYTPSTASTSYPGTGFATGDLVPGGYYWRVNNQIGGNWYPSVTGHFYTPTCPPGTNPTPTPAPTPTPGPVCPAGCTAPSNFSDSWSQPTGYGEGIGASWQVSNCSSTGTSCTTPLNSFVGGEGVIYDVRISGAAGPKIKDGAGTNAAGPCFCVTNGRATFTWSWNYKYEWCEVNGVGDTSCFANPTVQSFTTSSTSGGFTPKPNTWYHREVWAVVVAGEPGYSVWNQTSKSGSCACPTPTPSPTPPPAPVITLSGFSDCVDGSNPLVHLTWTSNTGNTGYSVFRDGGNQASLGNVRSWNSPGAQPSGSHSWLVQGTGGAFGTINSNTFSIVTATCTPPPADPSNLIVTSACNGATGLPEITFRWQNNSNIETGFWMDVSHDAFTGPSSTTGTNVWGVKGINYSAVGPSAVQFVWNNAPTTNTAGQLDSGDVDSAVAGNQLAPEQGVTYYWRVKAYSPSRQSNHVYPGGTDGPDADTILDGTITPPGVSFPTPNCKFDLAVENNPVGGNVQVYDPGATANLKVRVYNTPQGQVSFTGGAGTIGFWPTSATLPACSVPTPQTPTASQTISGTLAPGTDTTAGSFQDFTFTFTVSTTPGTYIANFYALPTCTPNNDINWTNNSFQLTYAVSAKAWFQTSGGDVGARAKIQVSNTTPPQPQSTYVLAGNPLDSSVGGTWELNNYTQPLFPTDSGKVYDYFNSRYRSKATTANCTVAPSSSALTIDRSSSAQWVSGTSISWPHTVGVGSNTALIVGVSVDSSAVSTATYGSSALTRVGMGNYGTLRVEFWGLMAPVSGTNTITVNLVSAPLKGVAGATSWFGVNGIEATTTSTGGTSNNPSVAFGAGVGYTALGLLAMSSGTLTPGAGQTSLWNTFSATNIWGSANSVVSTGIATTSWTNTVSAPWAFLGMSLSPKVSTGLASGNNYYMCAGDATAGGDFSAVTGNWVVFVDGNLRVTGNVILNNNSTLVFVVRGNITVNTSVTRADGVYIAGGTFTDYDNLKSSTSPLTVNGAIYANTFGLGRFLSNLPGCLPGCDNSINPADVVNYQPRYLIAISQMIGSPSVSWQEVAP